MQMVWIHPFLIQYNPHHTTKARFLEATTEKAKVEAEAAACQERLGLAERLVNGLSGENARWGSEVQRLKVRRAVLYICINI